MAKVTQISSRKADHIRINLEEDVSSGLDNGLSHYRFIHRALPEINLEDIDLSLELFGRRLRAPLLISSMTGGTDQAHQINLTLAAAAQTAGIALGLGSQRAAIEHPELVSTFQVRSVAPDVLLFANLGAIQLNYSYGVDECRRAIEMIEADALILHLNALQEALQPEGETRFAGLAAKIEEVCRKLPIPVIVKEVGWGFSEADIQLLASTGIAAVDVAGAGGTSWSQVEMHRAENMSQRRLAAAFINWGVPTAQAINNVRRIAPELKIFASGGLRDGIEITKCLALGASLGAAASPFLKAAAISFEETLRVAEELRREIQVCMFACGAVNLEELQIGRLTSV